MTSPIRPQFFCSRPNGTLTPLVALDELPSHVSVRGIPRVLAPGDTQGMTSLGTVSPRAQFYVVDGVSPSSARAVSTASGTGTGTGNGNGNQASQQHSRDVDVQNSLLKVVTDDTLPASQRLAFHALIQNGLAQNWVMSNPAASAWLTPNSGAAGSGRQAPHYNTKKEYCSYWIRHGECDYQQQGCLYKHEMPTDPAMLEKLGLRDIPRWYREKFGIPSLIPGGHHNSRAHASRNQHWQDSDGHERAGAFKAIQYPTRSGDHTGGPDKSLKQQKSAPNFHPVLQQPTAIAAHGQPRSPYATGMFSKGNASHKQTTRQHISAQQNVPPSKKIDLLSFDPLPDYPGFDSMGGNLSESPYSMTAAEDADRAQREDLVRSLQSLVPAPASAPGNAELLPSPMDTTTSQSRNRKQRSRRLYQPRSQIAIPDTDPNAVDMPLGPFKNNTTAATATATANANANNSSSSNNGCHRQSSVATLSSPASAISRNSTQMTSPLAGPVVGHNGDFHDVPSSDDPPTRVETPSMHSQSSSSSASMKKLPSPFPRTPGGHRGRPGAIGSGSSRRGYRKRSADRPSHDDLISLGVGRGK